MIARWIAVFFLSAAPALGSDAAELTPQDCPFAADSLPNGTNATCSSMTWTDADVDFRTAIAVYSPVDINDQSTAIIYIPGGPGDAPVTEDGEMSGILEMFPNRNVITLNPRGVDGTAPRPACTFGKDFWQDDLTSEREAEITADCRAAVDRQEIPLDRMDAPYLAKDITRMVAALELEKAGVFSVSYGTESALHLLAAKPDWLDFVIMDSVSLPGVLGIKQRLVARDRFLGIIDRLCFEEKACPASITRTYPDLMAWAGQFDKNPVKLRLGPNRLPWSLDGQDMLDFLASMTSYPDGAGYGPIFIEAFDGSRADTSKWVASELEVNFEYAAKNFALLYGAYSDSAERYTPAPVAGDTTYPFDVEEYQDYTVLFRLWNIEDRTEQRFVDADVEPVDAGIPVLILSGEADALTPVEWSLELHKRFNGLTHFSFPHLGHAVAFGSEDDVSDATVISELRCAPKIINLFLDKKPYGSCTRYQRKTPNE